jgi:hypothetical protein
VRVLSASPLAFGVIVDAHLVRACASVRRRRTRRSAPSSRTLTCCRRRSAMSLARLRPWIDGSRRFVCSGVVLLLVFRLCFASFHCSRLPLLCGCGLMFLFADFHSSQFSVLRFQVNEEMEKIELLYSDTKVLRTFIDSFLLCYRAHADWMCGFCMCRLKSSGGRPGWSPSCAARATPRRTHPRAPHQPAPLRVPL